MLDRMAFGTARRRCDIVLQGISRLLIICTIISMPLLIDIDLFWLLHGLPQLTTLYKPAYKCGVQLSSDSPG